MRVCLFLFGLLVAVGMCQPLAADDKPTGDFARVELRGKLGDRKFAFEAISRDRWDRWGVTVERKEGAQWFVLSIPDEATRKAATELVGQPVVVTGEIGLEQQGDGKRNETVVTVAVVTVKSLKKAEPPAK